MNLKEFQLKAKSNKNKIETKIFMTYRRHRPESFAVAGKQGS